MQKEETKETTKSVHHRYGLTSSKAKDSSMGTNTAPNRGEDQYKDTGEREVLCLCRRSKRADC